ncbi:MULTISPECIES: LacI family DNA-binding transcriptional regulator [unclassified Rathayibacter]|uniref:LacI family DNA-binding transcriptional regulator n=1 Tax=unclassified Rathayibacter TaxID=2609250 RepID=UPI0006F8FF87|nr:MULTISPECIES: LacI family DNA-binding transcriptional regulator [unclassified Rathayibacter]KQQ03578.1 LacI family transcriptional regulator [Rathayibacter sp. Leaf294]KQS12034.1 LacI family transcriptional regulator [Rathayibacter sp. Leaf185]
MSTTDHGRNGPVVTMRDVAKAAGVSVATVSHVVNDKPGARIGEGARLRVQEAVARLGYRPNALAKTLRHGSSRFIGLVADAIATTPFAGQIIHGAQDEAWRQGYVLLIANSDGNRAAEDEAIAMMLEHQVHGILYSTWYHREIVVPEMLQETDTVLVNCFAPGSGLPAVVPDEEQGGRTATEELLAAGHRRIAFINTTTVSPARSGRLAGYRSALDAAGLPFDEDLVVEASPEQEGGYLATERILASRAGAVFCHNDRVAMGLYDGLREHGLRIPEDVAVIGFDNQDVIAAHLRPPLTTVALPHYELGAAGVRLLLSRGATAAEHPQLVACPPVRRDSV